ncbi:MAG TPA: GNAT family N-acetyltransferase [Candidatus Binataceae bacterium]|nr:GNAT family N-acetyltransferase [Candidatus Binataceae bacterium]
MVERLTWAETERSIAWRHVTAEDLRLRFFGPMREVSHELLDKLIHYDPACAMAFIAVDEQSQKMLGVVRLHDDTSGETAEFAILVRSRLKEHGIGWLLMKHMIEFSKHEDLKIVRGQVLSENTTMLAMCAELGFSHSRRPGRSRRKDGDTAGAYRTS